MLWTPRVAWGTTTDHRTWLQVSALLHPPCHLVACRLHSASVPLWAICTLISSEQCYTFSNYSTSRTRTLNSKLCVQKSPFFFRNVPLRNLCPLLCTSVTVKVYGQPQGFSKELSSTCGVVDWSRCITETQTAVTHFSCFGLHTPICFNQLALGVFIFPVWFTSRFLLSFLKWEHWICF